MNTFISKFLFVAIVSLLTSNVFAANVLYCVTTSGSGTKFRLGHLSELTVTQTEAGYTYKATDCTTLLHKCYSKVYTTSTPVSRVGNELNSFFANGITISPTSNDTLTFQDEAAHFSMSFKARNCTLER